MCCQPGPANLALTDFLHPILCPGVPTTSLSECLPHCGELLACLSLLSRKWSGDSNHSVLMYFIPSYVLATLLIGIARLDRQTVGRMDGWMGQQMDDLLGCGQSSLHSKSLCQSSSEYVLCIFVSVLGGVDCLFVCLFYKTLGQLLNFLIPPFPYL